MGLGFVLGQKQFRIVEIDGVDFTYCKVQLRQSQLSVLDS